VQPAPNPATAPPAQSPPARQIHFSLTPRTELNGSADFDGATGDMASDRVGLGFGMSIPADQRGELSLGFDFEFSHYSFGTGATLAGITDPWADIHREELTLSYSHQQDQQLAWFIGASLGASGEEGAKFGDSLFGSVFGGARYALSPQLVVGLGLAVRSQIEDNALFVPLPVVNWRFNEQWTLSSTAAHPGLKLSYAPWENWTFSLSGEYDYRDFRLDNRGPIPGGVGRETRVPVMLSAKYAAGKQILVEAGLGYAVAQNLQVLNGAGNKIADQDLKGSIVFRLEFTYRF
jgi:hypothetical protein